jgi:uncharacterized protein YaaQ
MSPLSLLFAIVQPEDADVATKALTQAELRATRISSTGGFLQAGNVTLLLGLPHDEVERAASILAKHCKKRTAFLNVMAHPAEAGFEGLVAPIEVEIGGATLFALNVERSVRFGAQKEELSAPTHTLRRHAMKLILAITPEDVAQKILKALTDAEYRATHISSTGGFWRKGNATLLIGVEADKVDDVLKRIEAVCAQAPQPKSGQASATTFVLDVEQQLRV